MNKKKIEQFRKVLTEKVDELVREARESLGEYTAPQENYADMTDQASADLDRDFLRRLKDRERKLILKIRKRIEQLDDGSFDICEVCGETIDEKRLVARPETTLCIECKTDMEEQERRMEA